MKAVHYNLARVAKRAIQEMSKKILYV